MVHPAEYVIRIIILPQETRDTANTLVHDYCMQFDPVGPAETHLIRTIAQCDWDLRRYNGLQAQYMDDLDHPGRAKDNPKQELNRTIRQINCLNRIWVHSIRFLQKLQAQRRTGAPSPACPDQNLFVLPPLLTTPLDSSPSAISLSAITPDTGSAAPPPAAVPLSAPTPDIAPRKGTATHFPTPIPPRSARQNSSSPSTTPPRTLAS